ncbi:MAG: hypothetical protein R2722_04250 [Tessaracoccus sp.]
MSSEIARVTLADSLTKVTPSWTPTPHLSELSGWHGETVSFQVAWRPRRTMPTRLRTTLRVQVEGAGEVTFFAVDLVPAQLPCFDEAGDGYIATEASMLPDVLRPLEVSASGTVEATPTHIGWHSVWVDVPLPCPDLRVRAWIDDELHLDEEVAVAVVPRSLEPAQVSFAQWFHCDFLAAHYGLEMWSEDLWTAIESQMASAARMGVTALLTPVFTPPLDTAVGATRPTAQLLDISLADGRYEFGTTRLDRWMDALSRAGIHQVELPHLFTQWGAKAAPQIQVTVDGITSQRFGWDTPATDAAYQDFLAQLVPFLKDYFDAKVGRENTFYHLSDEPVLEHLESYAAARDSVQELLEGCVVIDALSHPEYNDLVGIPVVANDAVPTFREHGIEPSWVYYCVAQSFGVSNRFIAQDGVRTRAFGWQMYKAGAIGLLHWAFTTPPNSRPGPLTRS